MLRAGVVPAAAGVRTMQLTAGKRITNNIELVRPLSAGAMGSIWVARHHGLEIDVAVKFIQTQLASQVPDLLKRFQREARAAAQLKSPHVAQVFDHGQTEDGVPYIVMELLEGKDLGKWIQQRRRLPLRSVAGVIHQVAGVLAKAHAAGFVHRDIKPDNLFVLSSEERLFVKVLDFGVAREMEAGRSLTQSGALVGTLNYMSPEQLLGLPVDHRADLWALAVVAFEALTGKVPIQAEYLGEALVAMSERKIRRATDLVADLGPAVDAFFEHAFAEDIERRFSSARELAEAFTRLATASAQLSIAPVSATSEAAVQSSQPPRVSAPEPASTGAAVSAAAPVGVDGLPEPELDLRPAHRPRQSGARPAAAPASGAPGHPRPAKRSEPRPLSPRERMELEQSLHQVPSVRIDPTASAAPRARPGDQALGRVGLVLGAIAMATLLSAAAEVVVGTPQAALEAELGAPVWLTSGVTFLGLLSAIVLWVFSDFRRGGALWLGGLGALIFTLACGALTVDQLVPDAGVGPYTGWIGLTARLAVPVVLLSLTLFGLLRGKDELAEGSRAFGALLVLLALAGGGLAYQLTRPPLERLGVELPALPPAP